MNRDGRDSDDDADWLLAQLVSRQPPASQEPVVPPPAATPPAAVTRPPSPATSPAPPPRREEVLDWFSLAEPETATDAATRALPIIGGPPVAGPAVPPAAGTPPTSSFASPAVPPVMPPAAPTGLPSWNPPFMVGRPNSTVPHVSHPSTSPLKTVEPPVGDVPPVAAAPRSDVPTPPVTPAAAAAPVPPVADQAPVAPEAPVTPPGPVTPTSSFALTWGAGELDSEDAIRAAFRSLAGAGSTPPADAAAEASGPADSTAGHDVPPAAPAEEPHDSPPAPDVDALPFADFTPPSVARQSFTPVTRPTPTPPQHPIAPTTAPAGWDERPAPAAPQKDFDGELWSALIETDAPAPTEPQAAPVPTEPQAAPVSPAAPVPPAPTPVQPAAAAVPPAAPPAPPAAAPMLPVATPPAEAPIPSNQANGFPFIEVRGDAGSSAPALGTPTAESAVHSRVPYPAFASTGGDDRSRRPDSQPEPVDDLLAALGAGTAGPSRDVRPSSEPAAGQGGGLGGTPPELGGTPPSGPPEDPLDALRLAFNGDAENLDRDNEPHHDEPDAGAVPEQKDSPIAREIAETGYFWNLTPDPSAADPKADPAAPAAAADVPSPFGRPSPFAAEEGVPAFAEFEQEPAFEVQAEQEPEPAPEPAPEPESNWQFGGDALSSMFPPGPAEPVAPTAAPANAGSVSSPHNDDPLASLFGAASASAAAAPVAPAAAPTWPPAAPMATGAALGSAANAGTATRAPSALPQTAGSGGPGRGAPSGSGGGSGGSGGNRTVRTLFWIAGGLVVAVVIAGLFFLGTQLPFGGSGEAQSPSAEPGVTETPVPEPTAQQPVGVHAWNTLFGGECIDPFVSVWEEEFNVVDCAAPHAAQLVYRGELAADAAAPFPGEAEVGAQAIAACTADGVIDAGLVAGVPDLQVQGAYPVTEEQWTSGERTFYCFANRAGGEPLTASIAGPGPAA